MTWERESRSEAFEESETFKKVEAFNTKSNNFFRIPSFKALIPHESFPSGGGGNNEEDPHEMDNIAGFLSFVALAQVAACIFFPELIPIVVYTGPITALAAGFFKLL